MPKVFERLLDDAKRRKSTDNSEGIFEGHPVGYKPPTETEKQKLRLKRPMSRGVIYL
jgi:hypothetical protein